MDDGMKINEHQHEAGRLGNRNFSIEVLICLCLVVVTLFVYGQVRQHNFIDFDDDIYVTSNRYVRDGLTIEGLKWSLDFNNEKRTYWHPITWLEPLDDQRESAPSQHAVVLFRFQAMGRGSVAGGYCRGHFRPPSHRC